MSLSTNSILAWSTIMVNVVASGAGIIGSLFFIQMSKYAREEHEFRKEYEYSIFDNKKSNISPVNTSSSIPVNTSSSIPVNTSSSSTDTKNCKCVNCQCDPCKCAFSLSDELRNEQCNNCQCDDN